MQDKLTEERLRTWITDQSARERMCLSILALDTRFSNVVPRRPKGGPDGGRDIEANYGNEIVFGAIGFRNTVTDSQEDKRWVKSKFSDDLESALKACTSLYGLVFFTNVDLTPSEVDELITIAKQRGLTLIDIYYRERIRIVLDSPDGYALRFQFLSIGMTEPEQAAFFSRWEKGLESLILKNFNNVDLKLSKIEFLGQMTSDLRHISYVIQLKDNYTADDLGEYKFLASIYDPSSGREPWDSLYIAGYDNNITHFDGQVERALISIQQQSWYNYEEGLKSNCNVGFRERTSILNSLITLNGKSLPFSKMRDLDGKSISFFISDSLVDKVEGVFLIANNYIIAGAKGEDLRFTTQDPLFYEGLPDEFKNEKSNLNLVKVLRKLPGHPVFEERGTEFELSLTSITPSKVDNNAINFV